MELNYFYAREREINLEHWEAEGHHQLFKILAGLKVFSKIRVITENLGGNEFLVNYMKDGSYTFRAIARPPSYEKDVSPGAVVWIRGGFKPWIEPLIGVPELKKDHWVLFYGANTGNERWPYWHIILDDLTSEKFGKRIHDKLIIPYRKPINASVFYPDDLVAGPYQSGTYDVCLGASNVHDKKGQWLSAMVIAEFHRKYGRVISSFMPGGARGGAKTKEMFSSVMERPSDYGMLDITGTLSRVELADRLRRTKVFIHLGGGGQGDRGPMEALACGCYVILSNSGRHAPWFNDIEKGCYIVDFPSDDPTNIIGELADVLYQTLCKSIDKFSMSSLYNEHNGFFSHSVPMFKRLVTGFNHFQCPAAEQLDDVLEFYNDAIRFGSRDVR